MTPVYDPRLITELLQHQGRSVAWLAEKAGYSREHMSRMLNGSQPVSHELVAAAAVNLDVPVTWFYAREDAVA